MGLDGAVVLVTGGVRGVGAGITRAFLAKGATVITCARHTPDTPLGEFHLCDVREPDQVENLFHTITTEHGRLDVLVNNAGGSPFAQAADASPRFHDKVIALNLSAPLLVAQHANAVMQQHCGRRPGPAAPAHATRSAASRAQRLTPR